jgi:hypothetical protein
MDKSGREPEGDNGASRFALRLGLQYARGLRQEVGAYEPAWDDMRLRLAVNRHRVEMENTGDLASRKGPVVGAEDLGDRRWV